MKFKFNIKENGFNTLAVETKLTAEDFAGREEAHLVDEEGKRLGFAFYLTKFDGTFNADQLAAKHIEFKAPSKGGNLSFEISFDGAKDDLEATLIKLAVKAEALETQVLAASKVAKAEVAKAKTLIEVVETAEVKAVVAKPATATKRKYTKKA